VSRLDDEIEHVSRALARQRARIRELESACPAEHREEIDAYYGGVTGLYMRAQEKAHRIEAALQTLLTRRMRRDHGSTS